MKKAFATGLIILLPIAITAYIIVGLFNFFTDPFTQIVEQFLLTFEVVKDADLRHHALLVGAIARIIVVVFLVFLIFLLGFLARRFFFNQIASLVNKIVAKIPVVKTIYGVLSEATKAMLKPGQKAFKETVLVPFPHKDTRGLGFVTGVRPEGLKKVLDENNLAVFVPTAPHPISGYILFAPKSELIEVPLTTEETFAFMISCGMTVPPETTSSGTTLKDSTKPSY